MKKTFCLMLILVLATACANKIQTMNKNNIITGDIVEREPMQKDGGYSHLPTIVIYKTDRPYLNNVPVIMNDDKSDIISYPDPVDIYYNGQLAKPTQLKNEYLLDNRGITDNVAFTSYTYEEYSQLKAVPTKAELMKHIIARNPLIKFYFTRAHRVTSDEEVEYYNSIIDKGLVKWRHSDKLLEIPNIISIK